MSKRISVLQMDDACQKTSSSAPGATGGRGRTSCRRLECCSYGKGVDSEAWDSSEVLRRRGSVRVREYVQDPLDQARASPRNLQCVPSLLHGPAEADRY